MAMKQHMASMKPGGAKKGIEKPANIRVIKGKKASPSLATGKTGK